MSQNNGPISRLVNQSINSVVKPKKAAPPRMAPTAADYLLGRAQVPQPPAQAPNPIANQQRQNAQTVRRMSPGIDRVANPSNERRVQIRANTPGTPENTRELVRRQVAAFPIDGEMRAEVEALVDSALFIRTTYLDPETGMRRRVSPLASQNAIRQTGLLDPSDAMEVVALAKTPEGRLLLKTEVEQFRAQRGRGQAQAKELEALARPGNVDPNIAGIGAVIDAATMSPIGRAVSDVIQNDPANIAGALGAGEAVAGAFQDAGLWTLRNATLPLRMLGVDPDAIERGIRQFGQSAVRGFAGGVSSMTRIPQLLGSKEWADLSDAIDKGIAMRDADKPLDDTFFNEIGRAAGGVVAQIAPALITGGSSIGASVAGRMAASAVFGMTEAATNAAGGFDRAVKDGQNIEEARQRAFRAMPVDAIVSSVLNKLGAFSDLSPAWKKMFASSFTEGLQETFQTGLEGYVATGELDFTSPEAIKGGLLGMILGPLMGGGIDLATGTQMEGGAEAVPQRSAAASVPPAAESSQAREKEYQVWEARLQELEALLERASGDAMLPNGMPNPMSKTAIQRMISEHRKSRPAFFVIGGSQPSAKPQPRTEPTQMPTREQVAAMNVQPPANVPNMGALRKAAEGVAQPQTERAEPLRAWLDSASQDDIRKLFSKNDSDVASLGLQADVRARVMALAEAQGLAGEAAQNVRAYTPQQMTAKTKNRLAFIAKDEDGGEWWTNTQIALLGANLKTTSELSTDMTKVIRGALDGAKPITAVATIQDYTLDLQVTVFSDGTQMDARYWAVMQKANADSLVSRGGGKPVVAIKDGKPVAMVMPYAATESRANVAARLTGIPPAQLRPEPAPSNTTQEKLPNGVIRIDTNNGVRYAKAVNGEVPVGTPLYKTAEEAAKSEPAKPYVEPERKPVPAKGPKLSGAELAAAGAKARAEKSLGKSIGWRIDGQEKFGTVKEFADDLLKNGYTPRTEEETDFTALNRAKKIVEGTRGDRWGYVSPDEKAEIEQAKAVIANPPKKTVYRAYAPGDSREFFPITKAQHDYMVEQIESQPAQPQQRTEPTQMPTREQLAAMNVQPPTNVPDVPSLRKVAEGVGDATKKEPTAKEIGFDDIVVVSSPDGRLQRVGNVRGVANGNVTVWMGDNQITVPANQVRLASKEEATYSLGSRINESVQPTQESSAPSAVQGGQLLPVDAIAGMVGRGDEWGALADIERHIEAFTGADSRDPLVNLLASQVLREFDQFPRTTPVANRLPEAVLANFRRMVEAFPDVKDREPGSPAYEALSGNPAFTGMSVDELKDALAKRRQQEGARKNQEQQAAVASQARSLASYAPDLSPQYVKDIASRVANGEATREEAVATLQQAQSEEKARIEKRQFDEGVASNKPAAWTRGINKKQTRLSEDGRFWTDTHVLIVIPKSAKLPASMAPTNDPMPNEQIARVWDGNSTAADAPVLNRLGQVPGEADVYGIAGESIAIDRNRVALVEKLHGPLTLRGHSPRKAITAYNAKGSKVAVIMPMSVDDSYLQMARAKYQPQNTPAKAPESVSPGVQQAEGSTAGVTETNAQKQPKPRTQAQQRADAKKRDAALQDLVYGTPGTVIEKRGYTDTVVSYDKKQGTVIVSRTEDGRNMGQFTLMGGLDKRDVVSITAPDGTVLYGNRKLTDAAKERVEAMLAPKKRDASVSKKPEFPVQETKAKPETSKRKKSFGEAVSAMLAGDIYGNRAKAGGEVGINDKWYKGGQFLPISLKGLEESVAKAKRKASGGDRGVEVFGRAYRKLSPTEIPITEMLHDQYGFRVGAHYGPEFDEGYRPTSPPTRPDGKQDRKRIDELKAQKLGRWRKDEQTDQWVWEQRDSTKGTVRMAENKEFLSQAGFDADDRAPLREWMPVLEKAIADFEATGNTDGFVIDAAQYPQFVTINNAFRAIEAGVPLTPEMQKVFVEWLGSLPENQRNAFGMLAEQYGVTVPRASGKINLSDLAPKKPKPQSPAEPKVAKEMTMGRSRPVDQIDLDVPIVGPSGAKLTSYRWQWKESVEWNEGKQDFTEKRVSNWDAAVANLETGRDIVHQFVVEMPDGGTRVVSLETAAKVLGFNEPNASLKSAASSLKTKAKNLMRRQLLQAQLDAWDAAYARAEAVKLPEPQFRDGLSPVAQRRGLQEISVDGGDTWYIFNQRHYSRLDEINLAVRQWREDQAERESGVSGFKASSIRAEIKEIDKRIAKQAQQAKPQSPAEPKVVGEEDGVRGPKGKDVLLAPVVAETDKAVQVQVRFVNKKAKSGKRERFDSIWVPKSMISNGLVDSKFLSDKLDEALARHRQATKYAASFDDWRLDLGYVSRPAHLTSAEAAALQEGVERNEDARQWINTQRAKIANNSKYTRTEGVVKWKEVLEGAPDSVKGTDAYKSAVAEFNELFGKAYMPINLDPQSPDILASPSKPAKSKDTITVDGKERPRTNSNGQPIHPTEEGIRAFWRWFGGSKIVDEQGRPLVVYHGSPDMRFMGEDATFKSQAERFGGRGESTHAHWFASDTRTAKSYADDRRAYDYQNAEPGVIPAYLKALNPLVIDAQGQYWRDAQRRGQTADVIDEARNNGHDGVIIRNVKDDYNNSKATKPTTTLTVFSPTQIKSAIGNQGTFSPDNPSILASPRRVRRGMAPEPIKWEVAALPYDGPSIPLSDLRIDLEQAFGKLRTGTSAKGTKGVYVISPDIKYVRYGNDVVTAAHEIAHQLDARQGITNNIAGPALDQLRSGYFDRTIPENASQEVADMERFAVLVEAYVSDPERLKALTPELFGWMEKILPPKSLTALQNFSTKLRQYAGQSATAKASSSFVMGRQVNPVQRTVENIKAGSVERFTDNLTQGWLDQYGALLRSVDRIIGGGDRKEGARKRKENPLMDWEVALRDVPYTDEMFTAQMQEGFIDRRLSEQTGSVVTAPSFVQLVSHLEPGTDKFEENYRKATAYMNALRHLDWADRKKSEAEANIEAYTDAVNETKDAAIAQKRLDLMTKAVENGASNVALAIKPELDAYTKRITSIAKQKITRFSNAERKHAIRMGEESGLVAMGPGIKSTVEEARRALKELEPDMKMLRAFEKDYRALSDYNLNMLVWGGRLTPDQAATIRANNPHWFAVIRIDDREASLEEVVRAHLRPTRSIFGARNLVHSFQGSQRTKDDPLAALATRMRDVMQESHRNRALAQMTYLLKNAGFADGMEGELNRVRLEDGIAPTENQFTIWVNGEKQVWEVSKENSAVLQSMRAISMQGEDGKTLEAILRVLSKPASITRNLIINAPPFIVRNLTRDTIHRMTMVENFGPGAKVPKQSGLAESMGVGLGRSTIFEDPDSFVRRQKDALDDLTSKGHVVLRGRRAYQNLRESAEMVNRKAVFDQAYRAFRASGYNEYQATTLAAYAARESMTDFKKIGSNARALSQIIPFFSAQIAGTSTSMRQLGKNPAQVIKKLTVYSAVLMGLEQLWTALGGDDEEKELERLNNLDRYQRELFWNFRVGGDDGFWLSIPKGHEQSIYTTMVGQLAASLNEGRFGKPDSNRVPRAFVDNLLPVSTLPDAFGGWLPLVELVFNKKTFNDREIVPDYERNKEMSRRNIQYASPIGKALHGFLGVDARQWDYALEEMTGYYGRAITGMAEAENPDDAGRILLRFTGLNMPGSPTQNENVIAVDNLLRTFGKRPTGWENMKKAFFNAKTEAERQRAGRALVNRAKIVRERLEAWKPLPDEARKANVDLLFP